MSAPRSRHLPSPAPPPSNLGVARPSELGDAALRRGYLLDGLLAEGGTSLVYAARRLDDGSPVALKVLAEEHLGNAAFAARFHREIELSRRVAHPNLARAIDGGELPGGRLFLATERLLGRTLTQVVRDEGPLAIARALDWMEQVLAAVGALHAAAVVHGDLQPENVLIARERSWERAVVIDLGAALEPGARAIASDGEERGEATSGTPSFMAPEQWLGARAVTEKSDQFGVALLIHFALSGRLPFKDGDARETMIARLRAAPTRIESVRRDAPRGLDALLRRALAKHPEARFASALEMRAELGALAPSHRSWCAAREAS